MSVCAYDGAVKPPPPVQERNARPPVEAGRFTLEEDRRMDARLRRRTVRWLAAAPLALASSRLASAQGGRRLAATPQDAEGPFYPRTFPADADFDLMRVAGRAGMAQGKPLHLEGRVLATDGSPLAGATLELWQCDIHGSYHHVGGGGTQDPDFQGYGRAVAAADGSYAFVAMRPVPYGGRPPHLHFRIARTGARTLTTQLYLKGESAERGFAGMFARERERLEILPQPASGRGRDALAARYDFVLETA
jgi:protocatechuate 3,4-dioxygenase beta subunit